MSALPQTHPNRLIREKSPYLLQHARNPVDWYPWSGEAFDKARREDKPVFLSVGYSTCHWCHVMEEESFEDPEIARLMNEHFVSIKVDREERPDVDAVYMQAVMAMTGSGGWPMSVFLTPDGKPFYGGTYFPPDDRWGRPGFRTVLASIHERWKKNREILLRPSEELTRAVEAAARKKGERGLPEPDQEVLKKGFEQFASQFDDRYGGFGDAPKFPRSHSLSFLLRWWKRTRETEALEMAEKTFQAMAAGGIYDHLGGGFHRYATDRNWHIPHFEKMLYDQALLSRSYLEAYQAAGREEYACTARGIFEYVLRDLKDPSGAFYSAEDADSLPAGKAGTADPSRRPAKKSEGAFFLWTEEEIDRILGKDTAEIFKYGYHVQRDGNAVSDPHGEFTGKNILMQARSAEETASKFELSAHEVEEKWAAGRAALFKVREKRPRPHRDDKILCDWNGLMISSLAYGSRVLKEPRYAEAAKQAADFILKTMKRPDNRLMHRHREGETAIPAFLDDYAFLGLGLLDLYEAVLDPQYLEAAKGLASEMIRLFWDEASGGFFFTARDAEKLIARTKEIYDGAIPSGNSAAALLLLRAGRMTADRNLESFGRKIVETFAGELRQFPSGYSQMLIALDFTLGPSREIVIAGERENAATQEMLDKVNEKFYPNQVLLFRPVEGENEKRILALAPFIREQKAIQNKTTAYVCKNYICELPLTDPARLAELLKN